MAAKTVHGNRRQHLAQEFLVVVTDRGKRVLPKNRERSALILSAPDVASGMIRKKGILKLSLCLLSTLA